MIKFNNASGFGLAETFLCGQCFRWERSQNDVFYGIAGNRAAKIYTEENTICIESSDPDPLFWQNYLDLSFDYEKIAESFSNDPTFLPLIKAGKGIRILNQDLWETLVSFIISANNNIPRIKKIINKLCELYGEKIEFDGKTFYGFPTPEILSSLSLSDLAEIKAGFRDKYILDAAKKVMSGDVDLDKIPKLNNKTAKAELMKINGVGPKVSDCILLFALGRRDVFPLDVWTKRILFEKFNVSEKDMPKFIKEKFGKNAGILQQYLYYYYAVKGNDLAPKAG